MCSPSRLLQNYTETLEQLAAEQRRELTRLRSEARQAEADRTKRVRQSDHPAPVGELFCSLGTAGLPSKLRAIVEDNRVLKERARRLRERCAHWQAEVSQEQAARVAAEQRAAQLERDLVACSTTPAEAITLRVRHNSNST